MRHTKESKFKTKELTRHILTQHNTTQLIHTNNMSQPKLAMRFGSARPKATNNTLPRTTTGNSKTRNGDSTEPPALVETIVSSSSSLTSSLGIGEYGMNPARRGNAVAFAMAIKDNLFPKIKFLQGTNVSLEFSMDTKSICGFLRVHCGVSEADAYQWWEDHCMMLKNIHTDCRNNKIKMIKQQFIGKLISSANVCKAEKTLLTLPLTSLD
jgi:hypothetical protein